jgi:ABC-type glycerol-3-phosphate transport system permease component
MNDLGLLDTYAGIVAPDLVSVFGVFLMRQAIEVIPDDYLDAARIDGGSELRIFFLVDPAVDQARDSHAAHHQVHVELERVLLADGRDDQPQMRVVTIGLTSFTNMYFIEYNLLTAAAVLSVLPILVIFVLLQRWVVQAVVMSGLKG